MGQSTYVGTFQLEEFPLVYHLFELCPACTVGQDTKEPQE